MKNKTDENIIYDPVRFERQTVMPEIGKSGQKKLKESSVLVIGAGGLGSPNALYLAAAGIGTIGIADGDTVCLSNLNRSEESCEQAGIIGVTCGIAGSIQAAEAIKLILGEGTLLTGKLLSFDCFSMRFKKINAGGISESCSICKRSIMTYPE